MYTYNMNRTQIIIIKIAHWKVFTFFYIDVIIFTCIYAILHNFLWLSFFYTIVFIEVIDDNYNHDKINGN